MKSFIKILSVLLILSTSFAIAQPVNHPWKNIGSSGVQSTGGTHGLMTTAGTPIATKMSGGSFSTESGYLPGARKISGTSTTFNFGLESNWNMVSVPLRVSDFRKSTLYSAASSNAFTFENGYAQKETLSFGKGYWVKYPAPQLVSFSG
ncbi:MAG: hypothetical protein HYZ34_08330, partial [Ignavibacteriae bacterium]|nr:hypothetical protein [Ignavibacteriota bacterium]